MKFGIFNILDEVASLIFARLNRKELARSSMVSKEFKRLAEDNRYWKKIFKKRFQNLEWFPQLENICEKYNVNCKNIFNKLSLLKQGTERILVWQLVVLTENLTLIKEFFEAKNNKDYLLDKTYQRYENTSPLHYSALLDNTQLISFFLSKNQKIINSQRVRKLPTSMNQTN